DGGLAGGPEQVGERRDHRSGLAGKEHRQAEILREGPAQYRRTPLLVLELEQLKASHPTLQGLRNESAMPDAGRRRTATAQPGSSPAARPGAAQEPGAMDSLVAAA